MKVYTVRFDESLRWFCFDKLADLQDAVKERIEQDNFSEGEKIEIVVGSREMSEEEYETLPEGDGE